MKNLWPVALTLALFACSQTQQPAPSPQPAPQAATPAKPAFDAKAYDGVWLGKTGQKKKFSFTVAEGKITKLYVAGRFAGNGCSADTNTETTMPNGIALESKDLKFASGGSSSHGISSDVAGSFETPELARGTLKMRFVHNIPGVPGCSGRANTTWEATRQAPKAPKTAVPAG